ncbi:hypothetical protein CSIM01_09574 [Colletotrichum simmondsii]|uniref:Uncharacterized protein n=1 Tax=Colletotrichum simmondsii TaxID=703756 RepID=A0A135T3A0_9PEZI|nr:hypothetical protein CSIM01_09574 [Colletotrichum simmondsii]
MGDGVVLLLLAGFNRMQAKSDETVRGEEPLTEFRLAPAPQWNPSNLNLPSEHRKGRPTTMQILRWGKSRRMEMWEREILRVRALEPKSTTGTSMSAYLSTFPPRNTFFRPPRCGVIDIQPEYHYDPFLESHGVIFNRRCLLWAFLRETGTRPRL